MGIFDFLKSKKEPEELIKVGKLSEAATLYSQKLARLLKEDGENHGALHLLRHKLADLYIQLGKPELAVEHLSEQAKFYQDMGFDNKAVAIYKKALKIDPENPVLLEIIADFNRKVPKYMVNTQQADVMKLKAELLRRNLLKENGQNPE